MRALRALLITLACLAPTGALAGDAAALDEARRSYEELRYDEAALLLEGALDGGALDDEERRDALLLAGIVAVIRGDDEGAHGHFRELLERHPDVTLPSGLSPKITRVFEDVRAQVEAERAHSAMSPSAPAESEGARVDAAPVAGARDPQALGERSGAASEEAPDEGLSAVAVGVAAGAAVAAAVVVAGAGALFFLARAQPPESSLGVMQLP